LSVLGAFGEGFVLRQAAERVFPSHSIVVPQIPKPEQAAEAAPLRARWEKCRRSRRKAPSN